LQPYGFSHPNVEFSIQKTVQADTGTTGLPGGWLRGIMKFQVVSIKGDLTHMVQLTETAVTKVKEILGSQEPKPAGLRISVVGGGCSGFSYSMAFENTPNLLDKTYSFDGLKVFIDQASMLYLDGAEVDYVESMEGSGFKFSNPNVKSTCGCGSSFSV
jgi:iron-sulfur cluster assembly accessory protein